MASPDFAALKRILIGALDLPAAERAAYVAAECGNDRELRAEVEAKLARLEADVSILATGGLDGFVRSAVPPDDAATAEPPTADRYRILEKIGEGGFGEVFLAEQTEPVRRRVALKILKAGLDTKAVLARFEAERQALALMEHPGIARILDAGATEQGRPYFAMEYVDGLAITEYCDRQRLPNRERLELFGQVCLSIQHAHRKGIIHRDIKPSNVLVVVGDAPEVKVIDFGVAKALEKPLTEGTLFTETGQLIGTPEYMSPEQAEMSGRGIDTRTDVYSLGVLLYELLSGHRPFESAELRRAGLDGIRRTIREIDPPKPSTRVSTTARDTVTPLAVNRRTTPAALAGALRGDLDWITMKALDKSPERRYGSPAEFAQDIERHLRREPIVARPPSALYVLGRLASRHRVVFGVLATILVLVIGFGVWMSVLYAQADRLRIAAVEARQRAQARAEELELVTEFQTSMLGGVDAAEMGRTLFDDLSERVAAAGAKDAELGAFERALGGINATDVALRLLDRDVLRRAADAIGRDFEDRPEVRASLRSAVSETYRELGMFDEAFTLETAAAETRRTVLGAEHEKTLKSEVNLGNLLLEMGRFDEALPHCRETSEKCRRVLGADHRTTLTADLNLGSILRIKGQYEEALPYHEEALAGCRRLLGEEARETMAALSDLALLLQQMDRTEESLAYAEEALELKRRVLGEEDPSTVVSMMVTGAALVKLDRREEALPYHRDAWEANRRVSGDDHPRTLASLNNYAELLRQLGRYDESIDLLAPAEETYRRAFAGNLRRLGVFLTTLGRCRAATGAFEPARANLTEADGILGDPVKGSSRSHRSTLLGMCELYEAWHAAEPAAGHDRRLAEWRAKVPE